MNQTTTQAIDSKPKCFGIDLFCLTSRINRLRFLGLITFWYIFLLFSLFTVGIPYIGLLICPTLIVVAIVNMIFLQIRRFNDFNFRGWWMLVPLFHYIAFFIPGTKGPNRFGEQPPKASLPYILMALLLPIFITIAILIPEPGVTYHAKNFSMQFPSKYETSTKTFDGIVDEEAKTSTDDYLLQVETIDYSHATKEAMHNFLERMGIKSVAESLKVPAEKFIYNFSITNDNATNIKIISDKPIENKEIQGRLVQLSFNPGTKGKQMYTHAAIYLDEAHKQFYCLQAYYFDETKNKTMMEHALNSFKLKKN